MLFKNLRIFNLKDDFNVSADELENALSQYKIREPGQQEASKCGFATVFNDKTSVLVQAQNNRILFRFVIKERVLPSSVVKEEVEKRCDVLESETGHSVGRKKKADIKNDVLLEYLPNSFIRVKQDIHGYFDFNNRTLVIGSATKSVTETVTALIRKALGSLPITNLLGECTDPRILLTEWMKSHTMPPELEFLSKLKLSDASEESRKLDASNFELDSEELSSAFASGMLVDETEMQFNKSIKGVMSCDFTFKKMALSDVVREPLLEMDSKDKLAIMDAEFEIAASEIGKVKSFINEHFISEIQ